MLYEMGQLPQMEREKFIDSGDFAIRRKSHHWSGVWSDMAIEQDVMAPAKKIGGISSGRGVTEAVVAQWVGLTPAASGLTAALKQFTGLEMKSSDQHKEMRDSRKATDLSDTRSMLELIKKLDPFAARPQLRCISTGVVAHESANCHNASEEGARYI